MRPTHRTRTPYLFHFDGQTVALGEPKYLYVINEYLLTAKLSTRPTFWDHAYLADLAEADPEKFAPQLSTLQEAGGPSDHHLLNSVGVTCTQEEFWAAIDKAVFSSVTWDGGDDPLYLPEAPEWLRHARAWEFDPIAPAEGVGSMGGWVRVNGREGSGYPLGLFQLTSPDMFWVLGSAEDLDDVIALCQQLAGFRIGFNKVTAYYGHDATYSSIALPIECRATLEEELFIAGVDTETLFWD